MRLMPDPVDADAPTAWEDFLRDHSQEAFRSVVDQYLPLVWGTARRVLNGDAAAAQDVAQQVFAALAIGVAKGKVPLGVVIGAWLHRHTFFTATKLIRAESRRRHRESQAATAMHDHATASASSSDETLWTEWAPLLDKALDSLDAADREALVLRFYDQQPLKEIAQRQRTTDEAIRKRLHRALERLKKKLGPTAATLSIATLTSQLSARLAPAPPIGAAATVTAAAWRLAARGGAAGAGAAVSGLAGLLARITQWWRALEASAVAAGAVAAIVAVVTLCLWQPWSPASHHGGSGEVTRLNSRGTMLASKPLAAKGLPLTAEVEIFECLEPPHSTRFLTPRPFLDDATLLTQLIAEAKAHNPKVKHESFVLDVSHGYRTKREQIKEYVYPTEYEYSDKGLPLPLSFETKNIGLTVEMDVKAQGDAFVTQYAINHIFPPSKTEWPTRLVPQANDAKVTQPRFQNVDLRGEGEFRPDETHLAGIQYGGPGIDDGSRYFVSFITLRAPPTLPLSSNKELKPTESLVVECFGITIANVAGGDLPEAAQEAEFLTEALKQFEGSLIRDALHIAHYSRSMSRLGVKCRTGSIDEYIYPTEYEAARLLPDGSILCGPTSFETRNLGFSFEFESYRPADVEATSPVLRLNIAPSIVRNLGQRSIPTLRSPSPLGESGFQQPLFGTSGLSSGLSTANGLARLVGIMPVDDGNGSRILWFLRTTSQAMRPGTVTDLQAAEDFRLETSTFSVPRAMATERLLGRDAADIDSDAAWCVALSQQANDAEIKRVAVQVVATHIGQRAKNEAIEEFIHPTKFESLMPNAFETHNLGQTIEIESTWADVDGVLVTLAPHHDHVANAPGNEVAQLTSSPSTSLSLPVFDQQRHSATAFLPWRKARLVSAVGGMADGDRIELVFAKAVPIGSMAKLPQHPPEKASETTSQLTATVLSVSAEEGVAIQEALFSDPKAPLDHEVSTELAAQLIERLHQGQTHVLGTGLVSWGDQGFVKVFDGAEKIASSGTSKVPDHPDWTAVNQPLETRQVGFSFEAGQQAPGKENQGPPLEAIQIQVTIDTAPPLSAFDPQNATGRTEFYQSEFKPQPQVLPTDRPVVLGAAPNTAPANSPEAGRWVVLIGRQGRD
jgi:RNA polymerase sigma factor (sigma-70 family)